MSVFACRFAFAVLAGVVSAPAFAATHEILLSNFAFSPRTLTIQAGDTVRWRNTAGVHNVAADDASFRSGPAFNAPWTFERTFNQPGNVGYYCEPHGGPGGIGMSGMIAVQQAAATFQINEGIQGSWFNQPTAGQGFLIEVSPSINLFATAWFTWSPTASNAGEYFWLTGAGSYSSNRAELTLSRTRGGRFNATDTVQTTPAGTAVFTFNTCTTATVTFTLTDPPATGTIALQRILPASAICTAANPAR